MFTFLAVSTSRVRAQVLLMAMNHHATVFFSAFNAGSLPDRPLGFCGTHLAATLPVVTQRRHFFVQQSAHVHTSLQHPFHHANARSSQPTREPKTPIPYTVTPYPQIRKNKRRAKRPTPLFRDASEHDGCAWLSICPCTSIIAPDVALPQFSPSQSVCESGQQRHDSKVANVHQPKALKKNHYSSSNPKPRICTGAACTAWPHTSGVERETLDSNSARVSPVSRLDNNSRFGCIPYTWCRFRPRKIPIPDNPSWVAWSFNRKLCKRKIQLTWRQCRPIPEPSSTSSAQALM